MVFENRFEKQDDKLYMAASYLDTPDDLDAVTNGNYHPYCELLPDHSHPDGGDESFLKPPRFFVRLLHTFF